MKIIILLALLSLVIGCESSNGGSHTIVVTQLTEQQKSDFKGVFMPFYKGKGYKCESKENNRHIRCTKKYKDGSYTYTYTASVIDTGIDFRYYYTNSKYGLLLSSVDIEEKTANDFCVELFNKTSLNCNI